LTVQKLIDILSTIQDKNWCVQVALPEHKFKYKMYNVVMVSIDQLDNNEPTVRISID